MVATITGHQALSPGLNQWLSMSSVYIQSVLHTNVYELTGKFIVCTYIIMLVMGICVC